MIITPAILAKHEQDFRDRMVFAHQLPLGRWHVDVLDGSRHSATCWHDASVIGDMPDLPDIELHLMVQDPFTETLIWHRAVKSLRRVLLEADTPHLSQVLRQIHPLNLEISLVVNPGVMPDICAPFLERVDEVVVMGVHPGSSGQAFLGSEVLATLQRTRALFPLIDLAVDGGVRQDTVAALAKAGVMRVIAASALWKSASPGDAHQMLQEAAKIVL